MKTSFRNLQRILGLAVVLTGCPFLVSAALATDVAAEFGLGGVDSFSDEQTAQSHCQGDGVVWFDPKTGFYYPRYVPEYKASATGAFTCYKQAKKANYWGFGTSDALTGHSGRVFPSDCIWLFDKNGRSFCGNAGI